MGLVKIVNVNEVQSQLGQRLLLPYPSLPPSSSLQEIVTGERPKRGWLRPPHVPQECPQQVCCVCPRLLRQQQTCALPC